MEQIESWQNDTYEVFEGVNDPFEEPGYRNLQRCPYLPSNTTLDDVNIFKQSFRSIQSHFLWRAKRILENQLATRILIVYQCEFDSALKDKTSPVGQFYSDSVNLEKSAPPPLVARNFLRGGEFKASVKYAL